MTHHRIPRTWHRVANTEAVARLADEGDSHIERDDQLGVHLTRVGRSTYYAHVGAEAVTP